MKKMFTPIHLVLVCVIIMEWIFGLERANFLRLIGIQAVAFYAFLIVKGLLWKKKPIVVESNESDESDESDETDEDEDEDEDEGEDEDEDEDEDLPSTERKFDNG